MLSESLWPGLLLWTSLYVADYGLTLHCARMYRAGVRNVFVHEGSLELTPYFQKDVDSLRIVSPRFILALVWGVAILSVLCWLSSRSLVLREAYLFVLGSMVLVELAVHIRHARNISLFRAVLADAIRGRLEYGRAATLRTSATEIVAFAAAYLVIFFATWSWFCLGGSFGCASLAWKHARLSRKAQARDVRAAQQSADEALRGPGVGASRLNRSVGTHLKS
jgi:hypothetical protein